MGSVVSRCRRVEVVDQIWEVEHMSVTMAYLQDLSEADLSFVVKTIVDKRQDHDHICNLLKDKPDLVEIMLEDEKLFQRVNEEENIFLKISPFLLLTILIQQTKREMETRSYTMEIIGQRRQVPIFDAKAAVALIQNNNIRAYLARMLASFTRVDSTTVVYRARGLTYQRHFSEFDFDDVLELAGLVELPYRYDFYKRLADISLFITGIFPECLPGSKGGNAQLPEKHIGHSGRTLRDYEKDGRKYYDLASTYDEAKEQGLDQVLSQLAENFTIIRKPLNYLAANLMSKRHKDWFINP